MINFKEKYIKEIAPALKDKLGFKSIMEVPKLQKITINMGVGEASKEKGVLENALKDLEAISGQKPVVTKARKAVSTFKIREQYPIGCKVTLRGSKMYDFFERLINLAIPREKDFRGLNPKSFDGKGNYNLGIKEQIIFPEIDYDKVDKLRGMDIAITTSASGDNEAQELLAGFNFPFRGKNG
ncbi:MAG: 50S ribosomal protein L5 [Gammaproteobacteria bacterium]|uniref:Large ribosomal subunit protein uL5 n=1 Tax=SAR86 cluster bacterium TaxID=2030880 RepID=A0A520MY23_9GAMM|nr:50S ribosomal protein L5 [Gammaproteobacteria bacterium]MBA4730070.1 50S ribosomal protein L5 [SAR86 cluster bacterium]RPG35482.1 MAG: 50S ribosomal protein L5 [Gammaproteobacteria bacterium TMED193]RZO26125.1 MAG: 50S ribosomal protein L5 [SAR86 cluster bacterium]|tara:strand:- start:6897 stop:7445 length:549 start_codon:yes stop_codon:yes gene_type:complete